MVEAAWRGGPVAFAKYLHFLTFTGIYGYAVPYAGMLSSKDTSLPTSNQVRWHKGYPELNKADSTDSNRAHHVRKALLLTGALLQQLLQCAHCR